MAATLSLTSTSSALSILTSAAGNLIITTDIPLTSPPESYDVVLRVRGLIPDVDFSISGFTWVFVDVGVYDGTYSFGYQGLTPLLPLTFLVEPIKHSQVGNWTGLFELQASGDYNLGTTEVTMTFEGNRTDVLLAPSFISFDDIPVVGIKTTAFALIANQSDGTATVDSLIFPDDSGDELAIYYDNGTNGWALFVEGVSTFEIAGLTTKKIMIEFTSSFERASWSSNLKIGYTIVEDSYVSYWAIEDDTYTIALSECDNNCADITVNNITWLDGTVIDDIGENDTSVSLGNLYGCTSSTAIIEFVVTNNCSQVCSQDTSGTIRLGDMIHGWYSFLSTNDSGNVVMTFPNVETDEDFVLNPSETKTITCTVTCDTSRELHSFIAQFIKKDCVLASDVDPDTFAHGNVDCAATMSLYESQDDDFMPVDVDLFVQGQNSAALVESAISYNWGDYSVNESHTVGHFVAQVTGDYVFTFLYSLPESDGSIRTLAYFINGVYAGIVHNGTSAVSSIKIVTISLEATDTLSLGIWNDPTIEYIPIDSFTFIARYQQREDIPPACLLLSAEYGWTVVEDDVEVLYDSEQKTVTIGTKGTIPVTITNNSNVSQRITDITIPVPLLQLGLSIWFPEEVTIAVGQSHTFVFSVNPVIEGTVVDNVVFSREGGDDLGALITLETVTEGTECTIVPGSENIHVAVQLGEQYSDQYSLKFTTNTNSGFLEVIPVAGFDTMSFPISLAQTTASYKTLVNQNSVVYVPFYILVSGSCPQTLVITKMVHWRLLEDGTGAGLYGVGAVLCEGDVNITYTIECPTTLACPMFFKQNFLNLTDVKTGDEESFNTYLRFDRAVSGIGPVGITLTLPLDDTIVVFDDQPTITGLTYDISDVGENPAILRITVNPDTFVADEIPIALKYIIPGTVSNNIIPSSLSAVSVYDNSLFDCNPLTCSIYISVTTVTTLGGFEVRTRVQTATSCESIVIYDDSLYGADANHDLADFTSFRKIKITLPGGTQYIMSTHSPYDELILPAASNILAHTYSSTTGGIYTITLISVPSFNQAGTYLVGDCVIDTNNDFYISLQGNNTGYTPGQSVGWEDYWSLITEDTLEESYTNTVYYFQQCDIATCIEDLRRKIFCSPRDLCSYNICDNQCFMSYMKVKALYMVLLTAETLQWYDKMIELYNNINELCGCSNNCE